MQLMDLVRIQVELLALGSECRRDISSEGWLVTNRNDPNHYLNAFYPSREGFEYTERLRGQLREHYSANAREGYTVHYGRGGAADISYAAILVPADVQVTPTAGTEDFACVQTDDLDAWCRAYVAGSPHIPAGPLRERTIRLHESRDVRFYLFTLGRRAIGGGALVHMGGGAFLANGYSVMAAHRGDILNRARMVRMSTTHDVLAITSTRFARVLRRAMPQVRELGRLSYMRLDREVIADDPHRIVQQEPAAPVTPAWRATS